MIICNSVIAWNLLKSCSKLLLSRALLGSTPLLIRVVAAVFAQLGPAVDRLTVLVQWSVCRETPSSHLQFSSLVWSSPLSLSLALSLVTLVQMPQKRVHE